MKKNITRISITFLCLLMVVSVSSCGWLTNQIKNIKGELIGNHFNINFYDHFGNDVLTISGKKVGLQANYTENVSLDSEGNTITNYEQSSVITLTVDGNQVPFTGNTVVFAEEGLKKLEDFELAENIVTDGGGTINIADRNINKFKNILGTPKVVVVCSQLGVPIGVYGGEKVYWEIPDDLPKTTKLTIDGKALYIHRATYIMLDSDMVK